MNFVELIEVLAASKGSSKLIRGNSWINAKTGEQVSIGGEAGDTHSDYVWAYPEEFGIKRPERRDYEFIYPYMFKYGWIRAKIESYTLYFHLDPLNKNAKDTILEICTKALQEGYNPSSAVVIEIGDPYRKDYRTTLDAVVNDGYLDERKKNTFIGLIEVG